VIARLVAGGRERAEEIAQTVRERAPRFALIAARGSSDNAARYAKYLFGAHNRLAVGLAAPALHTIYRAPPDLRDALVVGVSQSGQSPDVVAVVADAAGQGAVTVALTNDEASPLAEVAAACLPLGAGEERAVAASKTYTSQVAAFAMLSAALEGDDRRWGEIAAVPDAMAAALEAGGAAAAAARRLAAATRIAVLGRGFNFATAFEVALKLKETSYVAAEPYSWADFLHGPVAIVEPGFPVVLVAPGGELDEDALEAARGLAARGAVIAAISDRDDLLGGAAVALRLPQSLPEWLSPLAAVVPGQLLALELATARGLDPDRPRGLAKVTRTR
jgi:glucosamine--fructose-6-phosphate aminotransferase (isomerizing)